jgi:hypothetical protein
MFGQCSSTERDLQLEVNPATNNRTANENIGQFTEPIK